MKSRNSLGFSLIELMVVVAVLAVFASIAVPSFTTIIANSRAETTASELHSLLVAGRSNAVTKRAPVTLATADWELVQAGAVTSTLEVQTSVSLTFTPSGLAALVFQPDGSISHNVEFRLCNSKGNKLFTINVQKSGVMRLSSVAASACS